jgi:hypothetical protein
VQAAEWRVRLCFGFLPNLALSNHKNALTVMGDMSPRCYFLKVVKSAFHDLTKAKLLPPAAASLLGLSLKFIPTPCHSPSLSDVAPSLNQLKQDIGLKTFFAGHHDDGETQVLCAKSSWRPPLPPQCINARITSFLQKMRKCVHRRQGTHNLTPHQ